MFRRPMNVTSLNIFPLKSGSGITVDRVKALNTGRRETVSLS